MKQVDVKELSNEQKTREQNRIRQLAFKARQKMPKDHQTFCLVAAHLVKNAHRYSKNNSPSKGGRKVEQVNFLEGTSEHFKCEVKTEPGLEQKPEMDVKVNVFKECGDESTKCKEVNRLLREIRMFKKQNRVIEQQSLVIKLKGDVGSYRCISRSSGIPLKTIHCWCSPRKERQHKATAQKKLRSDKFTNFLMQDTISFCNPSKKFAGKRFLLHSLEEVYNRYCQSTSISPTWKDIQDNYAYVQAEVSSSCRENSTEPVSVRLLREL